MCYAAFKHSDYDHFTDEDAFSDAGTVLRVLRVRHKTIFILLFNCLLSHLFSETKTRVYGMPNSDLCQ